MNKYAHGIKTRCKTKYVRKENCTTSVLHVRRSLQVLAAQEELASALFYKSFCCNLQIKIFGKWNFWGSKKYVHRYFGYSCSLSALQIYGSMIKSQVSVNELQQKIRNSQTKIIFRDIIRALLVPKWKKLFDKTAIINSPMLPFEIQLRLLTIYSSVDS